MVEKIALKERMTIPRQEMPTQDAMVRSTNFQEVPYGLTEEQALIEAARCLECKKQPCVDGCPVEVDIPGFINLIMEKEYSAMSLPHR